MKSGWIKLYRQLADKDLWLAEPFTRGQAWVDLILLANHKAGHIRKRGVRIDLQAGECGWSERELAARWKWSRGKVRRFFDELEEDEMIEKKVVPQKNNVTGSFKIIKYCSMQNGSTTDSTTDGPPTDHQRYQNKNEKNGKNGKNKDIDLLTPVPSSPLPSCPHEKILELYRDILPELPAVKKWTDKRQRLLRARWKEDKERQNLEWWRDYFNKVKASDFLMGKKATFRASLDFLLNGDKLIRTIEGHYDNKATSTSDLSDF